MSDEFDDFFNDAEDPTESPATANAAIAAALADDEPAFDGPTLPDIAFPSDGPVTLPGGFVVYDEDDNEKVTKRAEVRELNGVAEEALAKARNSENPSDFVAALLRHGVDTVGGKEANDDLLDEMLQGDREFLVLQIRRATYGDELALGDWFCDKCEETFDLTLNLDDIPVRQLRGERQFDVKLRKGRATVRLPDGHDYRAFLDGQHKTMSERNSVLLSRTVLAFTDATGEEHIVSGFPSLVRENLGIVDRKSILRAIVERQPGPRYDEVTYRHTCGNKILVPLGLMHLFQD